MTTANSRKESLFEAYGFRGLEFMTVEQRQPVIGGWSRRAIENSRLELQGQERGGGRVFTLSSPAHGVLLSPARPQLWSLLIQCHQLGPSIQMCENMGDIQTTTDVIIKSVDYSIQKTSIPQWISFFHTHWVSHLNSQLRDYKFPIPTAGIFRAWDKLWYDVFKDTVFLISLAACCFYCFITG